MANTFEPVTTTITKAVTIEPLRKVQTVQAIREAYKSVQAPLSPMWSDAQSEHQTEDAAQTRVPLKTFVQMERWFEANGYALVKITEH